MILAGPWVPPPEWLYRSCSHNSGKPDHQMRASSFSKPQLDPSVVKHQKLGLPKRKPSTQNAVTMGTTKTMKTQVGTEGRQHRFASRTREFDCEIRRD